MVIMKLNNYRLKDGEPCAHAGCLSHISHPCEYCGRIGGVSKSSIEHYIDEEAKRFLIEDYNKIKERLCANSAK